MFSHLFSIVSYRLQDRTQSFETNGNVKQMGSKEEVIEVPEDREHKIPQAVEEGLKIFNKII